MKCVSSLLCASHMLFTGHLCSFSCKSFFIYGSSIIYIVFLLHDFQVVIFAYKHISCFYKLFLRKAECASHVSLSVSTEQLILCFIMWDVWLFSALCVWYCFWQALITSSHLSYRVCLWFVLKISVCTPEWNGVALNTHGSVLILINKLDQVILF